MIMVLADYFARNQEKPHNLTWIAESFIMTMGVVIWILIAAKSKHINSYSRHLVFIIVDLRLTDEVFPDSRNCWDCC